MQWLTAAEFLLLIIVVWQGLAAIAAQIRKLSEDDDDAE